ncbi:MAG: hypothetical protein NC911_00835 [Candidatus Omnitrophica bacterium]|nr:hypothetical protein [Candidatus Omnitrophota bacterium]
MVIKIMEKSEKELRITVVAFSLMAEKEPLTSQRRLGKVCPVCGYRQSDIRRYRFLGCPDCYRHFSSLLLERLVGGDGYQLKHCGKTPLIWKKDREKLFPPGQDISPKTRRRLEELLKVLDDGFEATFSPPKSSKSK